MRSGSSLSALSGASEEEGAVQASGAAAARHEPIRRRACARLSGANAKQQPGRTDLPAPLTTTRAQIIACDVVNPNHISVTFDSIGGLENIKQALARVLVDLCSYACSPSDTLAPPTRLPQHDLVILPLVRPELFTRGKLLSPTKGVLLYGECALPAAVLLSLSPRLPWR